MLAARAFKGKGKKGNFKRFREKNDESAPVAKKKWKDLSRIQCFRCDKFGHFAKDCLSKSKPQAVAANFENPSPQRESSEKFEGFLFISALSSNVPTNCDTWLIDSGASCHIIGFREHLSNLKEKDSHLQVIIGDDACYFVKGAGYTSFQWDFGIPLHLSDVLFVPSIKRNLISISALEDKGYHVAFVDRKVLAWKKNSSIQSAHIIGFRHDSLYKLSTHPIQVLAHESSSSSELWHKRFGHLNFQTVFNGEGCHWSS